MTATDDTRRTVEAVWRLEAPRIIGRAGRVLRDFSLAEEVAQDALLARYHGRLDAPAADWLSTALDYRLTPGDDRSDACDVVVHAAH